MVNETPQRPRDRGRMDPREETTGRVPHFPSPSKPAPTIGAMCHPWYNHVAMRALWLFAEDEDDSEQALLLALAAEANAW